MIDNKLKMASLTVNDEILHLLSHYIERDYLRQPFTEEERLTQAEVDDLDKTDDEVNSIPDYSEQDSQK